MLLKLAAKMLRRRAGSAAATLVALALGVLILMAMGTLVESGLRFRPTPQRYAAADVVVAHRDLTVTGKDLGGELVSSTVELPEGGTVPSALVNRIRAIPGVGNAVADDAIPVVALAAPTTPTTGHGWGSAALIPYRITAGAEPRADDEIVVDAGLAAGAGGRLGPGRQTDVLAGGIARRYRISGIAEQSGSSGRPASVFFTDARAAALSPHPGRVNVVGVIAEPGADRGAVLAAVRRLADTAGTQVYAGADRGRAELSAASTARSLLIEVGASFGGYVVLLIVFVVAGTIGLSIRHRRRDFALLRAVAATPGQVRRMVLTEAALLSVVAAALGVPAGVFGGRWVHDELVARGFLPPDFPMTGGVLSAVAAVAAVTLVAVVSALIAARRVTGIRPTEALGEAAVEPARSGRVRLGFGLAALVAALSASVLSVGAAGTTALTGAIGMLYLFVLAIALLAPWINGFAARLLAPVLRTVWGTSGYLATAHLRANAQGMAAVLTALVLSVGFGGSVWFLQDNLERHTVTESRDGMLAEYVVTSPAGLPGAAVEAARHTPGVRATTAIRRTSVIVRSFDGAAPVTAQAIDPADATATMDLKVSAGSMTALHARSVAVSSLQAASQHWQVGDQVSLWLGDGTPVTLRVAAVYERGFGFGDVTLARDTVLGHTASNLDDQILIRAEPGADVSGALAKLAARHPGAAVLPTAEVTGQLATDLAISAWLNKLLITVMIGYAALAAANTMVMAALARRRELALLRLVGVTRRQVKRMVHAEQAGLLGVALAIGGAIAAVTLTAVVNTLTGHPTPYVPTLGWLTVLGGTTALALVTTVLPVGRLLRTPPVEDIGIKD